MVLTSLLQHKTAVLRQQYTLCGSRGDCRRFQFCRSWALCVKSNRHYAAQSPLKYRFKFKFVAESCLSSGAPEKSGVTQTSYHFSSHIQNVLEMEQFDMPAPVLFIHPISKRHCEERLSTFHACFCFQAKGGRNHVSHPIVSVTVKALKAIQMRIYSFVLKEGSKKS